MQSLKRVFVLSMACERQKIYNYVCELGPERLRSQILCCESGPTWLLKQVRTKSIAIVVGVLVTISGRFDRDGEC